MLGLRHASKRVLSTSSAASAPAPQRVRRWPRRLGRFALGTAVVGGTGYLLDRHFQAGALTRSIRTLSYGLLASIDYKLNFNKDNAEGIERLHQRSAARLYHCISANGGLYIKLGQAIGMQAAILPPSYREVFADIFDRAPTVPYAEVRQTFLREFGQPPEELFDSFDPVPVASASIAQVHRAVLNGNEVAVKVQKAAIAQQIKWDLACYYILLKLQEWWFEMPITFMHSFVSQQIIHETDFMREARNATRAAEDIQKDSWLRQRVYVPKVYWDRTTKRIMTAEWIGDSNRLNDVDAIVKRGFNTKYIMDTVISIISAQTFVFGFVHCDPHPGNVLIRPHPSDPSRPQVVLIDHGLYVELPEKFRKEYTTLWRSVFVGDIGAVERTVKLWGLAPGSRDMVASSILLRPHRMKKPGSRDLSQEERELTPEQQKEKAYQMQQEMMNRMKSFLQNEELIPRELMFIGRCQSMLQGNNQALGSPSNRVNLIAKWSAIGYRDVVPPVSSIFTLGPRPLLRTVFELIFFRVSLSLVDIAFRLTRFWQWCRGTSRVKGSGFEDLLDKQFRDMAKSEYGVEIDEAMFSG